MNLSRLAPDADADLLRSAASIVWERLEPHLIGPPIVSFQFLQPLSSSYDEAKIQAARQLVGADVTNALDDFALLLDGRDEALGARYRLELGVLSAADGPQRLARVVGRVGGAEAETPPSLWRPDTLPKVAFFCDQEWETKALDGDGSLDAVFSQVSAVLDSANELVDRFVSRLGLEDLEG
jgi:hypothetical protein